jgi:hypothetical protein
MGEADRSHKFWGGLSFTEYWKSHFSNTRVQTCVSLYIHPQGFWLRRLNFYIFVAAPVSGMLYSEIMARQLFVAFWGYCFMVLQTPLLPQQACV